MENIKEIQMHELGMLIEIDKIAKNNNIKYWLAYGTALGAIRHKGFIPWDSDTDIIVSIDDYKKLSNLLKKELSNKYIYRDIQSDKSYDSLQPRVTLKDDKGLKIHVDIYPLIGTPKGIFLKQIFRRIAYLNQRLFFLKNVASNINYKQKPKKRILSKILKLLLLPIQQRFFLKVDRLLASRYPWKESNEVYNIYGNYGAKEFIKKKWLGDGVKTDFEGYYFPVPEQYDKYLMHIYGDYMTPKKENYI